MRMVVLLNIEANLTKDVSLDHDEEIDDLLMTLSGILVHFPVQSRWTTSQVSLSHRAGVSGMYPYLFFPIILECWNPSQCLTVSSIAFQIPLKLKCTLIVFNILVDPSWPRLMWYHSTSWQLSEGGIQLSLLTVHNLCPSNSLVLICDGCFVL